MVLQGSCSCSVGQGVVSVSLSYCVQHTYMQVCVVKGLNVQCCKSLILHCTVHRHTQLKGTKTKTQPQINTTTTIPLIVGKYIPSSQIRRYCIYDTVLIFITARRLSVLPCHCCCYPSFWHPAWFVGPFIFTPWYMHKTSITGNDKQQQASIQRHINGPRNETCCSRCCWAH